MNPYLLAAFAVLILAALAIFTWNLHGYLTAKRDQRRRTTDHKTGDA